MTTMVIWPNPANATMDRNELNRHLPEVVNALVDSVVNEPRMKHLNRVFLPNRDVITHCIGLLRQIVFPGYFGKQGLTSDNVVYRIGELVTELTEPLYEQVRHCLRYRQQIPGDASEDRDCQDCDLHAATIVGKFLDRIPAVRELLSSDVQAAFDGDPAAQSVDETVLSYPGLYAIAVQRLAHELYLQDVPLLPRIMTEHAHNLTGIDIHPGARLGRSFFIDHGTGVVVGETVVIGEHVKVYQGVTLGALAPDFGQALRGQKRHPTIEDHVTIYAGATILGGETVVGHHCVIGGNVFVTRSVPPLNRVSTEAPKLKYRDRRHLARAHEEFMDFQI